MKIGDIVSYEVRDDAGLTEKMLEVGALEYVKQNNIQSDADLFDTLPKTGEVWTGIVVNTHHTYDAIAMKWAEAVCFYDYAKHNPHIIHVQSIKLVKSISIWKSLKIRFQLFFLRKTEISLSYEKL